MRLTVSVNGSNALIDALATAVEFYDNQNVRHFCYSIAIQNPVSSCTAQFARGSQVRIQRLVGLISEDEGRWRLSVWGGPCLGLDANIQPRGGLCTLTMDSDKSVTVGFERRPKLSIKQFLLDDPISVRWSLAYSTQKAGGNPTTRNGTFDCRSPLQLPVCALNDMYYDLGTVITVTAGDPTATVNPAFWKNWGDGCAHAGQFRACMVTLTGDLTISGFWAF